MTFTVSFVGRVKRDDGSTEFVPLTLTVDADGREAAWDAFKAKSGLRRWDGDTPPTITAATN